MRASNLLLDQDARRIPMPWISVALLSALLRSEGAMICARARLLLGWLAEGE